MGRDATGVPALWPGRAVGEPFRYASSFVGREALLAEVHELLREEGALVSLIGPAGVGKTRLAVELASGVRELRGGAPVFCDLRDARSLDDLVAVLASRVGVDTRERTPEQTLAVSAELLTGSLQLLVLDDADRLDADARLAVGRWLGSGGAPRVIVTARRRLAIERESVIEVPPLDLDNARRLFADRARPGALAEGAEDLGRLLERLDGLPLALELAAERTRLLTPKELLLRLDARFELLRAGQHSPLEDAVGLSWELLGEAARSVLTQLSVFRGGASLSAIESVVELHDAQLLLLDLVEELVERSLLLRATVGPPLMETRLVSYEAVQDYALGHGQAGTIAGARERHRIHFVHCSADWARGLHLQYAASSRARLSLERANILQALESSRIDHPRDALGATLALERILCTQGSTEGLIRLLDDAVNQTSNAGDAAWASALCARGWFLQSRGEGERATADLTLALTHARKDEDRLVEVTCLGRLGHHHLRYGNLDRARTLLEEALGLCGKCRLEAASAEVIDRLGIVALEQGDLDDAVARFEEAARIHERHGDLLGLATALSNGAVACLGQGRLTEARLDVSRVLELAATLANERYRGVALINLGLIEQEEEHLAEADSAYEEGLGILRAVGYRRAEATAHRRSGLLAMARGDSTTARKAIESALAIYRQHRYARDECRCLGLLALLSHLDGDSERARRDLGVAERTAGQCGPESLLAPVRRALGQAPPRDRVEPSEQIGGVGSGSFPEIRIVRRLVEHLSGVPDPGASTLTVEHAGNWFAMRDEAPVSLARRGPMRRVLVALAQLLAASPGACIDVHGLLEAGWPDERVLPDAGAARVYEAVRMLRRLGLTEVLLKREQGYLLDPKLRIHMVTTP